jgi:hypothetical protein
MTWFDNCGLYIESQKSLADKVKACDQVIDALMATLLRAASGDDIGEYQLNDGQTIIRMASRGVEGISKSLQAMKIIRQDYINRINGRVYRGMDSKNFRNTFGGQF